jgi:hypothetical protein
MILLDWTRMGRSYCLAGVAIEKGWVRTVRPLLSRCREAPVRNVGWSPFQIDGHQRWEVFELVKPEDALPEPPHLEDVWVRELKPRRRSAPVEQRRAVLESLAAKPGECIFGTPLLTTRASAYLRPRTGQRSLGTIVVPGGCISFMASHRQGVAEPDVRICIGVPPLDGRFLPLVDHHLRLRAERAAPDLNRQRQALNAAVQEMGERVVVRLGVSRPFQATPARGPGLCWLMVDGLFSLSDPQP